MCMSQEAVSIPLACNLRLFVSHIPLFLSLLLSLVGTPPSYLTVCFKIFDEDKDGILSREELTSAITHLQTIVRENSEETPEDIEDIVSSFGTVLFFTYYPTNYMLLCCSQIKRDPPPH